MCEIMDQDRNSRQVKKLCLAKLAIAFLDDEQRGYVPVFMLKKRSPRFFLSGVFNKFKVAKPIVPNLNFGKKSDYQNIFETASPFRYFILHSGLKQSMLLLDINGIK